MLKNLDYNKFKGKYRISSTRLPNWDYSWDGWYFVTICTKLKECFFGDIINGKMKLSKIGKIAEKFWGEIPIHFSFTKLDKFIVMPNHIHGIIIIQNNVDIHNVETQNFASLQNIKPIYKNQFGPQSKNLSSIIRGYKAGVKKWATMNKIEFIWQPRFYEHIVRNEKSLNTIRKYIIDNPAKWELGRDREEGSKFFDNFFNKLEQKTVSTIL